MPYDPNSKSKPAPKPKSKEEVLSDYQRAIDSFNIAGKIAGYIRRGMDEIGLGSDAEAADKPAPKRK